MRVHVCVQLCVSACVCVCALQIEDIRGSIDKIDTSVADIKKLYSTILSAPTSEKSKYMMKSYTLTHEPHDPRSHRIVYLSSIVHVALL